MADAANPWQEALAAIDLSSIEALKKLKQDQDVLDQRLASMDEMKTEVPAAVYQRVFDDYQMRRIALEEKSTPLKQAARAQYAKLRELGSRFEADHEAIQLDQQELKLRHKLGEFDDAEFEQRLKTIEGAVTDKAQAHEEAAGLKSRFLEAFHSESDLIDDPPRIPEPVKAPEPIPVPAATEQAATPSPDATQQFATLTPADLSEMRTNEVAAVQSGPPNKTQIMSAINLPDPALVAAANGATQVFRAARLVPQNTEAGRQSFVLALKPTNLGSDPANDVRISGPGVDPKHAQIAVSMGGFTIMDLSSKHGTRVNAEKVRERQLHHEDVIQIGAARYVFREG
jgi:FHA domain